MKALVLGGSGMLGHKLWQELSRSHHVTVTARGGAEALAPVAAGIAGPARVVEHVGPDAESLARAFRIAHPEVVINAIGIVKQAEAEPSALFDVNGAFPHLVAEHCRAAGARLIHLSTDCVFSGVRGHYTERDVPDPDDDYGRSKLKGEVSAAGCLTIRTSMIGRELASTRGLVEWFLAQQGGKVRGYRKAIFSGLPTILLARVIGDVIERHQSLEGIYHVAADAIDKLSLLRLLQAAYHLPVTIDPFDGVVIDRSLDGSRFRAATGLVAPAWPEMVRLMAADPTPYAQWRSSRGA
jgi:dTDP-4-dehydrorhamnose reductase